MSNDIDPTRSDRERSTKENNSPGKLPFPTIGASEVDEANFYIKLSQTSSPANTACVLISSLSLDAKEYLIEALHKQNVAPRNLLLTTFDDIAMLQKARDQRGWMAGLLNAQEDECRRIARELHDDISQRLATLDWDSSTLEQQIEDDPHSAKQKLQRFRSHLESLAADIRRVSHRLHPSILEDLGLRPAIENLVREFGEQEQMSAIFSGQDFPRPISLPIATGLYRITQEALRNVAKHAGKTEVKVSLRNISEGVQLTILDFGKGFDVEAHRKGLGLTSMEERAHLIGGRLQIKSVPGEGTQIIATVPLVPN